MQRYHDDWPNETDYVEQPFRDDDPSASGQLTSFVDILDRYNALTRVSSNADDLFGLQDAAGWTAAALVTSCVFYKLLVLFAQRRRCVLAQSVCPAIKKRGVVNSRGQ